MKTHSGTRKRVKISANGKIQRKHAGIRHRMISKTSHTTRRTGWEGVSDADAKRINKLLCR